MRMRKLISLLSAAVLVLALLPLGLVAQAATGTLSLTPSTLVAGETVTAVYTGTETVLCDWYVAQPRYVESDGKGGYKIVSGAPYSSFAKIEYKKPLTWTVPDMAAGMYVLCVLKENGTSWLAQSVAKVSGVPKLELGRDTVAVDDEVAAAAEEGMTPAAYNWYLFSADMVETNDKGAIVLKATVTDQQKAAAKLDNAAATLKVAKEAKGKYLLCETVDAAGAVLQQSAIYKVGASMAVGAEPQDKKTIFGFEYVDDGVKIGDIKNTDKGPTLPRRPSTGMAWNDVGETWGREWLGFPDNYSLTAKDHAEAPQGGRVGVWTNLVGEAYPEGTGSWAYTNINTNLDDPKNTYVEGATEFTFWVDATNYETNGSNLTFRPRIVSHYTAEAACEYAPSADSVALYVSGDQWVSAKATADGYLTIPKGYKGYVRMPLDTFVPNKDEAPAQMPLNKVISMVFYFFTYAGPNCKDSYALLDDFAFIGDDIKDAPIEEDEDLGPEDGFFFEPVNIIDEKVESSAVTANSATLKWDSIDGISKNYEINLYELEDEYSDMGEFVTTIKNITTEEYTLKDLKPDTFYGAQVVAYNANGSRIAIYEIAMFPTKAAAADDEDDDNNGSNNGGNNDADNDADDNNNAGNGTTDDEAGDVNTGVALPLAAFALAGVSGLLAVVSRKKKED